MHSNTEGKDYKVYEVYNDKNKLITKKDIQNFLKVGGITESIVDLKVWQQAFTNKSYSRYIYKSKYYKYIDKDESSEGFLPIQKRSNETLEWLGDAFLQSIVSMYLMGRYRKQNEGFLTKIRSKLVKTETLSKICKYLKLQEFLIISKHVEIISNGRNNAKLLEDLFESFIGAFITDFSKKVDDAYAYKLCKVFIINLYEKCIDFTDVIKNDDNYKDQLMRHFHKVYGGGLPKYKLVKTDTINKSNGSMYKQFTVHVIDTNGKKLGQGTARSKKEAEQQSAKQALNHFGISKSY